VDDAAGWRDAAMIMGVLRAYVQLGVVFIIFLSFIIRTVGFFWSRRLSNMALPRGELFPLALNSRKKSSFHYFDPFRKLSHKMNSTQNYFTI
jgi:hypothetical protein